MSLKGNAAFEVDCNTSKGPVTVRVIAESKDTAHEEAIRVLNGDVTEVLEVRDAPGEEYVEAPTEREIPESTGDDPLLDAESIAALEEVDARILRADDMKEVYYDPCSQCGSEMLSPLRLFPNEQAPVMINCYHCHAGMNKSIEEQFMYNLGMKLRPPQDGGTELATAA